MKLEPRACLWSGMMFRPSHAGQLFFSQKDALAFERSQMKAVLVHPDTKAALFDMSDKMDAHEGT